jgi:hypothetical protein
VFEILEFFLVEPVLIENKFMRRMILLKRRGTTRVETRIHVEEFHHS